MATQKFINNYGTTLTATFGAPDTTMTIADNYGLPVLSNGDFYTLTLYKLVGVEESAHCVVKVTARAGNVCTVQRIEGAMTQVFLAGDPVQARVSRSALEAKADVADVTALASSTAAALANKQDTLVSGTNIKTVDGVSILGNGNIQVNYNNLANKPITLASGNYKMVMTAGSASFSIRNNADTVDLFKVQDDVTGTTIATKLGVTNSAGSKASVSFRSGTNDRWSLDKSAAVEGGANAGSNFALISYSDDGTALDTVLAVSRATSVADFSQIPTVAGNQVATLAAVQTMANKTMLSPTITGYTETRAVASGTAFSPDISAATVFGYATTGNTTTTLPAPAVGKSFEIQYTYGGAHTLAFAVTGGTTLLWDGGVVPTPTSVNGKTDVYVFECTKLNGTLQWVGAKTKGNF